MAKASVPVIGDKDVPGKNNKLYYQLASLKWTDDVNVAGGGYWGPPEGAGGFIDLRSIPAHAKNQDGVNACFCWSEDAPVNDATSIVLGDGNLQSVNANTWMRDAWESRTGVSVTGDKLADLLWDHLTDKADPSGNDTVRPMMPGSKESLDLEIIGLGKIKERKFNGLQSDSYSSQVIAVELVELRKLWKEVEKGAVVEEVYQYALGGVAATYKLSGSNVLDLLPSGDTTVPKLTPKWPGTLKTETWAGLSDGSYSADFTADNSWLRYAGTWVKGSSELYNSTNGNTGIALNYAFGGNDLIANLTFGYINPNPANLSGIALGPATRIPGIGSMYLSWFYGGALTYLSKFVGGTRTDFGNTSLAYATDDVLLNSAIGSTIAAKKNGGAAVLSTTDTAIPSGTRIGLWAFNNSSGNLRSKQVTGDDGISTTTSTTTTTAAPTTTTTTTTSAPTTTTQAPMNCHQSHCFSVGHRVGM